MKKFIIGLVIFTTLLLITGCNNSTSQVNKINVYLFWGDGCPHCENAKEFFASIEDEYGKYFDLVTYEVWYNEDNNELMEKVATKLNKKVDGVPFIVIGNQSFGGFNSSMAEDIKKEIQNQNSNENYIDIVKEIDRKD